VGSGLSIDPEAPAEVVAERQDEALLHVLDLVVFEVGERKRGGTLAGARRGTVRTAVTGRTVLRGLPVLTVI
jgi:hypothetical protein